MERTGLPGLAHERTALSGEGPCGAHDGNDRRAHQNQGHEQTRYDKRTHVLDTPGKRAGFRKFKAGRLFRRSESFTIRFFRA